MYMANHGGALPNYLLKNCIEGTFLYLRQIGRRAASQRQKVNPPPGTARDGNDQGTGHGRGGRGLHLDARADPV
jgi:hypothetical protein